jgi:hypothetical protein
MADIFISYSRRNSDFVKQLNSAMKANGRDVWVDFEDIPLSADWWGEIKSNIEAADTFVFVISPDSLASPICHFELAYATEHNKRLIPIVHVLTDEAAMVESLSTRPLDDNMQAILAGRNLSALARQNWQAISRHNWIFFQNTPDFDLNFKKLIIAIDTDLDHVRRHTRLLVRSREWEARGKSVDFLLGGGEINEYSSWVRQSAEKEPKPTELQLEYLFDSQRAANRRQAFLSIGTMIGIVVTGVLIAFAYFQNQRIQEVEQTRVAIELENAEQEATSVAQGIILTEQQATNDANRLLSTAQIATNIARQTAISQDQSERIATAQAGFIFLTQQADGQATATSVNATLVDLVAENTSLVSTLTVFEALATRFVQQGFVDSNDDVTPSWADITATAQWLAVPPTQAPPPTLTPTPIVTTVALGIESEMQTNAMQVIIDQSEQTLYVNPTYGNNGNNCLSESNACQTIGEALNKAPDNSVIRLALGIYNENISIDRNVALVSSDRDLTILSPAPTGSANSIITIAEAGILRLENITISGGYSPQNGAGILNNGTLVATNIVLSGNIADGNGGGLANFGNAVLLGSTISNNVALLGGGVYNAANARYYADSTTSNANNSVVINRDAPNVLSDTCPIRARERHAEALTVCSGLSTGQACVLGGEVVLTDLLDNTTTVTSNSPIVQMDTWVSMAISPFDGNTSGEVLMNIGSPLQSSPDQISSAYVRGNEPAQLTGADLTLGGQAVTSPGFGTPLNIRRDPSTSAGIITGVFDGVVVSLIEGPIEADGFTWWRIRLPNGIDGWSVSNFNNQPTLRAVSYTGIGVGGIYTIFGAGSRGLNLRTNPSTDAELITTVLQGRDVVVLDGPIEADGFRWWRVVTTYSNEIGWLVESADGQNTLIPVVTQRVGLPEVYGFTANGDCLFIDQNPLRYDTPDGSFRIALSTLGGSWR